MLEPLSAADIASGLRPARDSLVELCVVANAGTDRWPGRKEERLDLRDFGRLKVLRVASELVFGMNGPRRERKGFTGFCRLLWRFWMSVLRLLVSIVFPLPKDMYANTVIIPSSTSASIPESSAAKKKKKKKKEIISPSSI